MGQLVFPCLFLCQEATCFSWLVPIPCFPLTTAPMLFCLLTPAAIYRILFAIESNVFTGLGIRMLMSLRCVCVVVGHCYTHHTLFSFLPVITEASRFKSIAAAPVWTLVLSLPCLSRCSVPFFPILSCHSVQIATYNSPSVI